MMVMIVSSSRPGNDIQASTRRCAAIELLEDLGVLVKETNTFQYRHEGKERFRIMGEQVRAFVPDPLPPANPPLAMRGPAGELHAGALAALSRLAVAGTMVPSTDWFLYGFVRKEAAVTSQIEGVQATFPDVVTYEATDRAERFEDVQEVCNYVDALAYARAHSPIRTGCRSASDCCATPIAS